MRISLLWATLVASASLISVGWLTAQGPTSPPATAAPRTAGTPSVAVIDIGYIFKNHARFKAAMDDIKREFDQFEADVRTQRDLMVQKTETLKSLPAGSNEYKALEEELADKSTKMRLDIGRKQKDRVEQEAKIYYNAYKEIELCVSRFADRYGVDLIVRFNSDEMDPSKPDTILQGINRTVVFHRNLNITNHILQELNGGTPLEKITRPPIPPGPTRTR